MKKTNNICLGEVDFSNFELNEKVVTINGKELPFKIGDKIKLISNEPIVKTVINICICEDGRIQYGLEWYDPNTGTFSKEILTLTELKLLHDNCQDKPVEKKEIGFKNKK